MNRSDKHTLETESFVDEQTGLGCMAAFTATWVDRDMARNRKIHPQFACDFFLVTKYSIMFLLSPQRRHEDFEPLVGQLIKYCVMMLPPCGGSASWHSKSHVQ